MLKARHTRSGGGAQRERFQQSHPCVEESPTHQAKEKVRDLSLEECILNKGGGGENERRLHEERKEASVKEKGSSYEKVYKKSSDPDAYYHAKGRHEALGVNVLIMSSINLSPLPNTKHVVQEIVKQALHAPCNSLSFEVQPHKSTYPYLKRSSSSQGLFETAKVLESESAAGLKWSAQSTPILKADSMHKLCEPKTGWPAALSSLDVPIGQLQADSMHKSCGPKLDGLLHHPLRLACCTIHHARSSMTQRACHDTRFNP
ncbi:hypothetical protein VNO77_44263 [Canavalia gladiata]|uniref:Uncharacterized protein n=1 Tax=Canavalia gladiata TaxID=3824 RepID=A0AAN9PQL3_CANGL